MNAQKHIILGIVSTMAAVATAYTAGAQDTLDFRTTGYFVGLTQGTNNVKVAENKKAASKVVAEPAFDNVSFAGHNLVNLTMGRNLNDTNFPNQVMAMTFACDLSSADLVVYDLAASNVVAMIAASVSIDTIYQQDARTAPGPDHAHFVATLQVNQIGGLMGGYFTVAGRLNINPTNGCPQPIAVSLDRDSLDGVLDNTELPSGLDPDNSPLKMRTGLAHLIGVVDVNVGGNPQTVLVPYGGLSIRRELPTPAPAVIPDIVKAK